MQAASTPRARSSRPRSALAAAGLLAAPPAQAQFQERTLRLSVPVPEASIRRATASPRWRPARWRKAAAS